MPGLVFIILFVVIVVIAKSVSGSTSPAGIIRRGVPARGILLSVAPQPSGVVGTAPMRYQRRGVQIDVEIPGRAPYVVNAMPLIPMNLVRDVVPGATVELRVDPKNPQQIAIVGPGVGFNAALLNAGATTTQGMS